jgi:hypothetical protein
VLRAVGGHRDSPNIWVSLEWGLSQQGGSAQCSRRTFAPRSVNRALMAGQRYRFLGFDRKVTAGQRYRISSLTYSSKI